jgi:hypothetical protein
MFKVTDYNKHILYQGKSLKQAIKAARKNDCGYGSATIIRISDGAKLLNWHAARPYRPANITYWQEID